MHKYWFAAYQIILTSYIFRLLGFLEAALLVFRTNQMHQLKTISLSYYPTHETEECKLRGADNGTVTDV